MPNIVSKFGHKCLCPIVCSQVEPWANARLKRCVAIIHKPYILSSGDHQKCQDEMFHKHLECRKAYGRIILLGKLKRKEGGKKQAYTYTRTQTLSLFIPSCRSNAYYELLYSKKSTVEDRQAL